MERVHQSDVFGQQSDRVGNVRRHREHVSRHQVKLFVAKEENNFTGNNIRHLFMGMGMGWIRFVCRAVVKIDDHHHKLIRVGQITGAARTDALRRDAG